MTSVRVDLGSLEQFCMTALRACGADEPTQTATTRSILHGSVNGVDSHGVRLLPHYIRVFENGRLNKTPRLRFERKKAGTGILDADHAQGARAMYAAMDHAVELAQDAGIAAVAVQNSSHFGPAGAYSVHLAIPTPMSVCMMGQSGSMARTPFPLRCQQAAQIRGCWIWRRPRCR